MTEPKLLWKPSEESINQSNLRTFMLWLEKAGNKSFSDYNSLWQWSAANPGEFWESIWRYFNILHDGEYTEVISAGTMPGTKWFEGTKLNYAEHIFSRASDQNPAIIFKAEGEPVRTISWPDLKQQVASLQRLLKDHDIGEGSTVGAYLPCTPEATIAFLATSSVGAIWSSCSPDFGSGSVTDRLAQINPRVLFVTDRYRYGGKSFAKTESIEEILKGIPSVKLVIAVSADNPHFEGRKTLRWSDVVSDKAASLSFARVPFSAPLWVLYSSGTTGLPKAITHSHGGILLEQFKYGAFHNDFRQGENCFWYTTTGWMMWNYIHGSLLAGATMVLYDGSPAWPDLDALWNFCEEVQIAHFGTSAGFILACMKAGIQPGKSRNLSALRSIGSTGSPLPPEGFDWIYREVKTDLWLTSMSGGTDVCSAFVGGNPMLPVYAGEIQCRALGCSLEAYNESGEPLTGDEGEMVITRPMPSMPVFFWNDPSCERYSESYFEMYPGVWRHGDWIKITSRGGVVIYGRSDATLNRGGVRIGTSEIYRAVDQVEEAADSLVVCIEKDGGEFWMPLFVRLREGFNLDHDLRKKIAAAIRTTCSPRHVPDEIIPVPDIPYTISGKKTEMPVKKILMGKDPSKVVSSGSLRNPASLEFFVALARDRVSS